MSVLAFRCAACGGVNRVDPSRLLDRPTCGRCQAALDVSGAPLALGDDELTKLVAASPVPVLVDFHAAWCPPCRVVGPIVDRYARAHAGRAIVVKVDTDRHARTFAALGGTSIPTFALYEGGELRDRRTGALPAPELEAWVRPWLERAAATRAG